MYYEDLVKFSIFGVSGNLMDAVEVEEQGIESEGREYYWRYFLCCTYMSLLLSITRP